MPGLPSSPGASNSEGDDAHARWQDAVICVPVPRVPGLRGCSRRCCPGQPSWPRPARCRSSGSVPSAYGTRPRPGMGHQPSLGRKRQEGVRGMGSLHVPRLAWQRRAMLRRGRRGCAALAVAVLAALTLVNGAQHPAYGATEGPLRRDRGGGAGHRAGGELRHRRAGRRLQRHLGQRHGQQLPLRRRRPRDHRGHAGHHRGRRRLRHGLDHARPVVQLHRQRRRPPGPTASPSGWPRRTGSPTRCTSPTPPAPT